MANFKKLGEVTLAENASDSANVLIEESGEIKRVPKTEVGGGNSYVLILTSDNATMSTGSKVVITCTEKYRDIYNVLISGGNVWVDLSYMIGATNTGVCRNTVITYILLDGVLTLVVYSDGSFVEITFSNE